MTTRVLPHGVSSAEVFCPGCLVVQGQPYVVDKDQAARLANESVFAHWPLVVLHDDARVAARSFQRRSFLSWLPGRSGPALCCRQGSSRKAGERIRLRTL